MADADTFKDLIVLIPGILGSRLVRREGSKTVTVWDFSIISLPRTLRQLASGRLDVTSLISHRFPFPQAAEAYKLIGDTASSLGIVLQYPAPAGVRSRP